MCRGAGKGGITSRECIIAKAGSSHSEEGWGPQGLCPRAMFLHQGMGVKDRLQLEGDSSFGLHLLLTQNPS